MTVAAAALVVLTWAAAPGPGQDAERLRAAKTLFFDRKYAEAREAWRAVQAEAAGPEAEAAGYWVARCSENLGDTERAFGEYGEYLARRPTDRVLAEEARTSRIGLAARLYKAGQRQRLPVLKEALADPEKSVRYYAAFQLASLGPGAGEAAVPILKRIVAEEVDDDLVERAKIYLLKLDPRGLAESVERNPPRPAPRQASWIRVRLYEKGKTTPQVSVNLPVALAELVFDSLPDEARTKLRLKGYDPDNFWQRLRKLGPTEIIDIQGDDGGKIQIWLE